MINKEECQNACLYLLEHCYETDAPSLDNGDPNKTYTFTPSGFKESEIFKQLIEEHFNPQPLLLKDFNKINYVWDRAFEEIIQVVDFDEERKWITAKTFDGLIETRFQKNRFLRVDIPHRGTSNEK